MSKHRLFGRLPSHRRFARPIEVTIHHDIDGWYSVTSEHTTIFGSGPTKGEALADFKQALITDFIELSRPEHVLFWPIQQELDWMRSVITWR
jgi:hypothetical protein